jgi:hypothetical protein
VSGWPRVIEDADGLWIRVKPEDGAVVVSTEHNHRYLSVEDAAALIAAITDAAKVVTGEKA